MKKIDVCLSPDLIHLYDLKGQAVVVVDIFRATSCMVTAFAHGAAEILPVEDVELCASYGAQGYLTAAERNGVTPEGFDFDNSPFSYQVERVKVQNLCDNDKRHGGSSSVGLSSTSLCRRIFEHFTRERCASCVERRCLNRLCRMERQTKFGGHLICRCVD